MSIASPPRAPASGAIRPSSLRARSQHAAVVFEDQQLSCVGCHGSHGVKSVAAWKQAASRPNDYCLTCHSRPLTLQRPDGTSMELAVDALKLKASVHPDHDCADCHTGFSTSAHPAGATGERGNRAIAAAGTCARCHDDKLRQAEGSVHFTLLRSGAQGAPGCTDCHSAHEVAPKERFATLAGTPCRACHAKIFAAYSREHARQGPRVRRSLRRPAVLGLPPRPRRAGQRPPRTGPRGLHRLPPDRRGDPRGLAAERRLCTWAPSPAPPATPRRRSGWLPCVSSRRDTGRTLTEREVGDLLGGDVRAAFDPAGSGMSGLDLWSSMRRLESLRQSSAAKLDIVGRLEVVRGIDAHRLADKSGAVRACESCHTNGSTAFDRVALTLARDDGRPKRFDASQGMLTDAASVMSVHGFYALGATTAHACSTGCSSWRSPAACRSSRFTSHSASGPRAPTRKGDHHGREEGLHPPAAGADLALVERRRFRAAHPHGAADPLPRHHRPGVLRGLGAAPQLRGLRADGLLPALALLLPHLGQDQELPDGAAARGSSTPTPSSRRSTTATASSAVRRTRTTPRRTPSSTRCRS